MSLLRNRRLILTALCTVIVLLTIWVGGGSPDLLFRFLYVVVGLVLLHPLAFLQILWHLPLVGIAVLALFCAVAYIPVLAWRRSDIRAELIAVVLITGMWIGTGVAQQYYRTVTFIGDTEQITIYNNNVLTREQSQTLLRNVKYHIDGFTLWKGEHEGWASTGKGDAKRLRISVCGGFFKVEGIDLFIFYFDGPSRATWDKLNRMNDPSGGPSTGR